MRLKDKTNPFGHHFVNVASDTAQLFKTFKGNSFCQFVHFNPISASFQFSKHCSGSLQNQTVNLGLFGGKFTVNWEWNGHIWTVVVERVSLVGQHCLSANQSLVVVMIVKRGCGRTTSTNRKIRGYSSSEVLLLSQKIEETFDLAFAHARFHILKHIAMWFSRDLTCPSHCQNLFVVFDHTWLW